MAETVEDLGAGVEDQSAFIGDIYGKLFEREFLGELDYLCANGSGGRLGGDTRYGILQTFRFVFVNEWDGSVAELVDDKTETESRGGQEPDKDEVGAESFHED